MSTKAEMIALVDAKLPTGSSIPAIDHRATMHTDADSAITNFYGTQIIDSNASTNIVTEDASTKTYSLAIMKKGGSVHISGNIHNNTGSLTATGLIGGVTWFDITTPEYEQLSGTTIYVTGNSAGSGEPIQFLLNTNSFAALSPIGINETIYIDFTYNTNT